MIEVTNTTDLTVVETVIVSPFTNYTATVVAYTNAGSGDSVMQVAVSPEAGLSEIMHECLTYWDYAPVHFLPSQCLAQSKI